MGVWQNLPCAIQVYVKKDPTLENQPQGVKFSNLRFELYGPLQMLKRL